MCAYAYKYANNYIYICIYVCTYMLYVYIYAHVHMLVFVDRGRTEDRRGCAHSMAGPRVYLLSAVIVCALTLC